MKEKLVIILGPTAIGKTEISLSIAENLNGEIISSDSMQIYNYMDIGSAKATQLDQERVNHHMIDIVNPDEDFTVSDFKERSVNIISKLNAESKLPIVTGGTGLYINSLVYDLNFTKAEPDENLRRNLEVMAKTQGVKSVYNILKRLDLASAEKLHPNDLKRVIRAIEIFKQTGIKASIYNKNFRKENTKYDLKMLGLNMDRQKLYDRINKRVDQMVEAGLVEEVQSLINKGYHKDLVALQGIGYKEIIYYLDGELSLDNAIKLLKKRTRNYAKRQLTWFRRDKRIYWFNKDDYSNQKDLILDMISYIKS